MNRYPKRWLLFLFIIFSFNASFSIADQGKSLEIIPVVYQQIDHEYVVDAVVEAVNQATISAQTSGQVLEIYFDVDDFVKKGEALARLKSVEQTASVSQTRANLAEAEANVNAAQKEYNRIKQVFAKGAVSAAQMDKTTADLEAAQARLNAVRASLSQAGQQIEYTIIKAPYSGIVLKRHIELGEIATPGKPIMTGFSLDEMRVVATVPQSQLSAIQQYMKAHILLNDAHGERYLEGTKITVLPYADPQTHTFKVRVAFAEDVENVYPGMFAKVAFTIGQEKRLTIPVSAVAYRGEIRAVYVVNPQNQVSMRQIRLGSIRGDRVEILAGLEANEKIAVNPVDAAIVLKTQRNVPTTGVKHD